MDHVHPFSIAMLNSQRVKQSVSRFVSRIMRVQSSLVSSQASQVPASIARQAQHGKWRVVGASTSIVPSRGWSCLNSKCADVDWLNIIAAFLQCLKFPSTKQFSGFLLSLQPMINQVSPSWRWQKTAWTDRRWQLVEALNKNHTMEIKHREHQWTSMNIIEHSFSTCLSCTQQSTPVTRGNKRYKSLNHQDGGPSIPGLSFPPGRTKKTRNCERKQRKPTKKQKTRDHTIR